MLLLQQIDVLGGHRAVPSLPGMLKPHLREVSTLPTWDYCFLAYVAMRTEDGQVRGICWLMQLFIIRESQRHGGTGWLDYFRQQAALDASMRWNTLDPSIQASTLVGHAPSHTVVCGLCREPDHVASQCALAYLQPPKSPASQADPTVMVLSARMSARWLESQA